MLGLLLDALVGEKVLALGLELGRRDRLDGRVDRPQAGDLHRQVTNQLLELVGARHEVGLAVDLDQNADPATGMDVAADEALASLTAGPLGSGRLSPLPQKRRRLLEVAVRFLESALAVHYSCAA